MFLILTPSSLQGFSSRETDFHLCQHLSNFFKYSSSNFLSSHPNNNFAVYFPSSSLLLNSSAFGFNLIFYLSSISSYLLTFTPILPSNLLTNSLAFSKSSSFSHVLLWNTLNTNNFYFVFFYFSDFILI